MKFLRQEYWSGLPFPSPGDLPDPGMEPESPASSALAGRFFTTEPPGKPGNSSLSEANPEDGFPFLYLLGALCVWGGVGWGR